MRVRINDVLIFDEDTMSFSPINSFLPTIKLGSIHTRCFSLLCRKKINNESVASKKELFYEGWEKHGLVSSDNSLAQTVFQIRKALRPFNLADSIGTIPRVGFALRRVKIEMAHPLLLDKSIEDQSSKIFGHLKFLRSKNHSNEHISLKKSQEDGEEMVAYLPYSVPMIVCFIVAYISYKNFYKNYF